LLIKASKTGGSLDLSSLGMNSAAEAVQELEN
jgi:hypothetical protein